MDLLEDLKISLLNFNFVMAYIIHKMLVLLKNYLNYLKYNIILKYRRLLCFSKNNFFSHYVMMENSRPEEENKIKDKRNLFRREKKIVSNCK